MTSRRVPARSRPKLPRLSARERYAVVFLIGLVALLVGVAQVWPPAAWILGGLGGMAFALIGLAGRTNR